MAFSVIDHYPGINAEGVARNSRIKVTFNKPINPDSVQPYNFSVVNSNTYEPVPGTYSYEYSSTGYTITVVFTPSENMLPNARYEAYVHGKPHSILAQDNDQLQFAYSWSFVTGTDILDNLDISGVSLNLENLFYYEDTNKLKLIWSQNLDSFDDNADLWMSTTNGGTSHTVLLTAPHTYSISDNELLITLTSGNASELESWYAVDNSLKLKLAANEVEYAGRYNSFINWRDVTYVSSGTLITGSLYDPEDYPDISGYTAFEVLSTSPKHQQPNLSGIDRIRIRFTGLPVSNCNIYDYITFEVEDVLL